MSTTETSGSEPQHNFFKQLLGELGAAPEPTPAPTPEEIAAAAAGLGDVIHDLAAIAVGVRARAVEGGISDERADAMAVATYANLLQVNLHG